jgi:hypothetical protein
MKLTGVGVNIELELEFTGKGKAVVRLRDRWRARWCVLSACLRVLATPLERFIGDLADTPPPPGPDGAKFLGDLRTLGAAVAGDDCECPICMTRRAMKAVMGQPVAADKSKLN